MNQNPRAPDKKDTIFMPSLERFKNLVFSCGGNGGFEDIFSQIERRYQEPHRQYHTLNHLAHCLQEFDEVKHLASDPKGIELALWFHDVVYDPKQKDNEIQSAHLAKSLLRKLGLNDELIDHVADFILMTRHQPGTFPADGQLLLDIDLSILGSSELHYRQYATAIRKEFHQVSDTDYRFGRSQFLKMFLDRPNLYHTDYFQKKYEDQARRNIEQEIAFLTPPTT